MTRLREEIVEDAVPTLKISSFNPTLSDQSPLGQLQPGSSQNINVSKDSPNPSEKSNNISIVSLQDEDGNSSSTVSDTDNESDDNESTSDIKYVVEAVKHSAINSSIIPKNGSVILTQAIAQAATTSRPPKIGNVAVQNSSDITFGNKTFYQGPVTIKQFLLDGNNRWVEREQTNQSYVASSDDSSINRSETTGNALKRRLPAIQGYGTIPLEEKPFSPNCNWKRYAFVPIVLGLVFIIMLYFLIPKLPNGSDSDQLTTPRNQFPTTQFNPDATVTKLRLVSRATWLAQPPAGELDVQPIMPLDKIIIIHTATEPCYDQGKCVLNVRLIQDFHIRSREYSDIAYNYLVGGDGQAYEGRGWNYVGSHTKGYNFGYLGIAFIGTFSNATGTPPPKRQFDAVKLLIEEGVILNKIAANYTIYPHRCFYPPPSPGDPVVNVIDKWPHYFRQMQPNFTCVYS